LTTEQFLERVNREYGDKPHGDDYRYLIKMVEEHPGLASARMKTATPVAETI
jgi:hypothetical protein